MGPKPYCNRIVTALHHAKVGQRCKSGSCACTAPAPIRWAAASVAPAAAVLGRRRPSDGSASRRRRGRRRRRRRRERRRARRAGHRRGPQGLRAGRRGRPGRTLSICSRSVSSLHPIDETGGPCLGGQGGTAKSGHLVHFGLAYLHLAWISLG